MELGNERTIVITTETPEPGSAGTEGDERGAEGGQAGEAAPSIGAVHDGGTEDPSMQVQELDDVRWENDLCGVDNQHNWMTAAGADILDVRCKTVVGQLHKTRLGSGGRGRCIQRQGKWLTPTEFEALSGRAQSKDWKRSIRFGGKSLQSVIDAGLLLPHAASCACANCSDEPTVSAPVKLFTPYRKRKFRSAASSSSPPPPPADTSPDVAGEADRPPSPTDQDQADVVAEITSLPADLMWDRLEELSRGLLRQALSLKQVIRSCRERSAADAAVNTDSVGVQPAVGKRSTPPKPSPVQPANAATMCSNCNRPPTVECGSCHAVTYCSAFCCQKDWPTHRGGGCRPAAPAPAPAAGDVSDPTTTSVMFILADGSDRLITVSQTH